MVVGVFEEAVYGGLKIDDRVEYPALETAVGQLGEVTFDRVEPRGRGWREVEDEAGMPCQPFPDLGRFVGGVVVEDDMDQLARWNCRLDGVEETDELLMPMALHTFSDDLALQHIEGGEQGGGAVTLIVVGHRAAPSRLQRQPWLGAVERLNLAFFIHGQDDGVSRGIDVKTDDVSNLGGKLWVVG